MVTGLKLRHPLKYHLITSYFTQDDFQQPQGVFVREPKLAFKL